MRTVIRMLHEAAERYPGRAYLTKKTDSGWAPFTYSDVDAASDCIAAFLIACGYKPEFTFGILAEGRSEWVIAEYGVLKARLISIPLSIKLSPEEIAFRLTHSEARGIFVSSNTLDIVCGAFQLMSAKPVLFYLDDEDEHLRRHVAERGWKSGTDYLTWNTLLTRGADLLKHFPSRVKDIEAEINENDTVNICYTSGTTGNPKGIMLTHLNYWVNSHDADLQHQLPDCVLETLIVLPVDHSFAHTVGIYTSMLKGITLHFVDARGSNASIIRNFPANLTEVNPMFLMTVPSISGTFMKKMKQGVAQKGRFLNWIFQHGLQAGIKRNGDGFNRVPVYIKITSLFFYKLASLLIFPSLRRIFGNRIQYCVGGGALLEIRQQHFFAAIGVPIYQGYGLTEAAPIISSNSPRRFKFGTSGIVAASVSCRIMKSETVEAGVGERGEIVIKGENVMKGYFRNSEATAAVLRDEPDGRWLWTGDLGYFDRDGFLVVTGRVKALLIARDGEKYSPEEVEEIMLNNTDILNQLLVYNDHKAFTIALVTLQNDLVKKLIKDRNIRTPAEALKMIIGRLRTCAPLAVKSIPAQWIPSRFAIIPGEFSDTDGLVNSTMKLVRHKIIEFYQKRIDALYESDERNDRQNLMAVEKVYFS